VPDKGEQMVRYYGFYSNVSRGKRKKQDQDGLISSILEPDGSSKEHRKNWARLIQKIYEADPLRCPPCGGEMMIISFITDPQVIRQIPEHLAYGSDRGNLQTRGVYLPLVGLACLRLAYTS
jgi:hypothetical protein